MDIIEFADTIQQTLEIKKVPSGSWRCAFEYSDIQKGYFFLVGKSGYGDTPEEAIRNYIKMIQGETIIFHAMRKKIRKEFRVPNILTLR